MAAPFLLPLLMLGAAAGMYRGKQYLDERGEMRKANIAGNAIDQLLNDSSLMGPGGNIQVQQPQQYTYGGAPVVLGQGIEGTETEGMGPLQYQNWIDQYQYNDQVMADDNAQLMQLTRDLGGATAPTQAPGAAQPAGTPTPSVFDTPPPASGSLPGLPPQEYSPFVDQVQPPGISERPRIGPQLELAAGLMGSPYLRDVGNQIMQQLITGSAAEQGTRERLSAEMAFRAAMQGQRIEAQNEQFAVQDQRLRDEFAINVEKYGQEFAWEKYKFGQEQLTKRREFEARRKQAEAQLALSSQRYTKDGGIIYPTGDPNNPMGVFYSPGTEGYQDRMNYMDDFAMMEREVTNLINLVENNITAVGEGKARGDAIYARVGAQLRKLQGYGVLNGPGEAEMFKQGFRDPADWTDPFLAPNYRETLRILQQEVRPKFERWSQQGIVHGSMALPPPPTDGAIPPLPEGAVPGLGN